jgi:hypothetical protein
MVKRQDLIQVDKNFEDITPEVGMGLVLNLLMETVNC